VLHFVIEMTAAVGCGLT